MSSKCVSLLQLWQWTFFTTAAPKRLSTTVGSGALSGPAFRETGKEKLVREKRIQFRIWFIDLNGIDFELFLVYVLENEPVEVLNFDSYQHVIVAVRFVKQTKGRCLGDLPQNPQKIARLCRSFNE